MGRLHPWSVPDPEPDTDPYLLHSVTSGSGSGPPLVLIHGVAGSQKVWDRVVPLLEPHATVIRILSSADLVPDEVYGEGLQLFFAIAEAMTTGMTAAAEAAGKHQESPELTAVACLMMLERVNYLISTEVQLPVPEMADKIADIMFAAFGLVFP